MRTTILIAALFSATAAPAIAADVAPAATRIHIADLDLASPSGKAMLDRRVGRALENVCGSYATVEADMQQQIQACRAATRAQIDRTLATLPAAPAAYAAR